MRKSKGPPNPSKPTALSRVFSSFASPDFRLLWSYNVLGSVGKSMETLTLGWLVLIATDSPFWVGAVFGLQGLGQISFGAIGGVIADRLNRRMVLFVVQLLRAIIYLMLALLVISESVELWHLLIVGLLQGILLATLLPSSEALVYDTVGPRRLLNAVAFTNVAFSLSSIFSFLLAGFLISAVGVGPTYLVISGVLVLSPLPILRIRTSHSRPPVEASFWRNLTEGMSYATKTRPIRSLLMFSLVMELFGFSYLIMLPVIARDVLYVGAVGLGFLAAAGSVGEVLGNLTLASLGDFKAKSLMVALGGLAAGLSLLLFALSSWFALSLVLACLIGVSLGAYDPTMSTSLQLRSADFMRGRILGLYNLTFGFTPLGGFVAGAVATALNPSFAVGMGGVIIMASVGFILLPTRSLWKQVEVPAPRTVAQSDR